MGCDQEHRVRDLPLDVHCADAVLWLSPMLWHKRIKSEVWMDIWWVGRKKEYIFIKAKFWDGCLESKDKN